MFAVISNGIFSLILPTDLLAVYLNFRVFSLVSVFITGRIFGYSWSEFSANHFSVLFSTQSSMQERMRSKFLDTMFQI